MHDHCTRTIVLPTLHTYHILHTHMYARDINRRCAFIRQPRDDPTTTPRRPRVLVCTRASIRASAHARDRTHVRTRMRAPSGDAQCDDASAHERIAPNAPEGRRARPTSHARHVRVRVRAIEYCSCRRTQTRRTPIIRRRRLLPQCDAAQNEMSMREMRNSILACMVWINNAMRDRRGRGAQCDCESCA
jgi:hypothetical protein